MTLTSDLLLQQPRVVSRLGVWHHFGDVQSANDAPRSHAPAVHNATYRETVILEHYLSK